MAFRNSSFAMHTWIVDGRWIGRDVEFSGRDALCRSILGR